MAAVVIEIACFLPNICSAKDLGVALNLQDYAIEFLVSRHTLALFFMRYISCVSALRCSVLPYLSLTVFSVLSKVNEAI